MAKTGLSTQSNHDYRWVSCLQMGWSTHIAFVIKLIYFSSLFRNKASCWKPVKLLFKSSYNDNTDYIKLALQAKLNC